MGFRSSAGGVRPGGRGLPDHSGEFCGRWLYKAPCKILQQPDNSGRQFQSLIIRETDVAEITGGDVPAPGDYFQGFGNGFGGKFQGVSRFHGGFLVLRPVSALWLPRSRSFGFTITSRSGGVCYPFNMCCHDDLPVGVLRSPHHVDHRGPGACEFCQLIKPIIVSL